MVGYNERKLEILLYVLKVGEACAREVSDALEISYHNASVLLGKYYSKQGLLSREKVDMYGTRVYSITSKGRERIDRLSQSLDDDDETEDKFDEEESEDGEETHVFNQEFTDRLTQKFKDYLNKFPPQKCVIK